MGLNTTISIIIVNYNTGDELQLCVASILDSKQKKEIIVVDNASKDNSLDLVKSAFSDESELQILRNESNLGFARGCNIGTGLAKGKYLLYLNPDCIVEKNTISKLGDMLDSNLAAGMVGGLILNPDGSEQAGCRREVPTPWRSFVRAFGLYRLKKFYPSLFSDFNCHLEPLPDHPVEVEAISGACMLVRREALDDVGGFDEGYFLHCEDLDWCYRMRQKGWKILFVPDARLKHIKGASSRSRFIFVEWHKHKGMTRFYRKFFRHQYPGVLMWLVKLGVWLRFVMLVCFRFIGQTFKRLGLRHE